MNPEKQRIAIAEACGWHSPRTGPYGHLYMFNGNDACGSIPPDYPNDLNAMHEAEKVLTKGQQHSYKVYLYVELEGTWHATAAQRAEAFLKTIGKWGNE